jgi:hypothetical protein
VAQDFRGSRCLYVPPGEIDMKKSPKIRIYCTATVQINEAIEALLWQGLSGSTRSEVIERLICQAVELQIIRGHLTHAQLSEPKDKP